MRTAAMVRKASRGVRGLVRIAIGVLFVYAGWMKLRHPQPAVDFLESVLYADLAWAVPFVAAAELSLGLWLLTGVRADRAATVAFVSFLGFGLLHGFAIAAPTPPPPCGCLGQIEAVKEWSPWTWIGINALLASASGMIALAHSRETAPREHVDAERVISHAT